MTTFRSDWYERPFLNAAFTMFMTNRAEDEGSDDEEEMWVLFVRFIESCNLVAPEFCLSVREFPWHIL